jgi:cardiolipin synthase
MPASESVKYQLMDDPLKFYDAMLEDIRNASKYIYLETYKFANDAIGQRFREALINKARDGVNVKVLIDSWGASVSSSFFSELTDEGGEVRFFTKIKFFVDFFTKNHRRNHRKFMTIDDNISYIGSANITAYSIGWRELMLRMEGGIAKVFKRVFNLDFKLYNKYIFEKNSYVRQLRFEDFEIVRDVPSIAMKKINKKFMHLIKNAEKSIVIETPYFLPGFLLRKALMDAAKRGVKVQAIIPRHSDVGLVDILRNKYLGPLHQHKIEFLYYCPSNLHAKALLIDDKISAIGSPNFDYRSFRYQHEIILISHDSSIAKQLKEHIWVTIQNTRPFDFEKWARRPRFQRFVEWLLLPFRHLL